MANWTSFVNQVKKDDIMRLALDSVEYERSRLVFKKRMALGLSQLDLAEKANVDEQIISRIEGADKGISTGYIAKVMKAIKIDK